MDRYVTFVDRVASNPHTYTRTVNSNGTVSLTLNDSPSETGTQINASLVNGLQDHFYNQYLTDKNALVETFTNLGYSATTNTTFAQFIEWAEEVSYFKDENDNTLKIKRENLTPIIATLDANTTSFSSYKTATYAECGSIDGQTVYLWGGSNLGTSVYLYEANDGTWTLVGTAPATSYSYFQGHTTVLNSKIYYATGTYIYSFDGSTWTVETSSWGSSISSYGGTAGCDINNYFYIRETTSTGVASSTFYIWYYDVINKTVTKTSFSSGEFGSSEGTAMVCLDRILYYIDLNYYILTYDPSTDEHDWFSRTNSVSYNGKFVKTGNNVAYLMGGYYAYCFKGADYWDSDLRGYNGNISNRHYYPAMLLNDRMCTFVAYNSKSPQISTMKYLLRE